MDLRARTGPDNWAQALFTLEAIAKTARDAGDWPFADWAARQMLEHDPNYAGGHYALALVAERGTPVQLTFGPGRVTIAGATQGQAKAKESVPADFSGDEPSIAFSPQYLLDGVIAATVAQPGEAAAEAARVRLRFTSATKPAVITPASAAA